MPEQIDDFEAGICYQSSNVGFGSDMIDLAGVGCSEPLIFSRTKTKYEAASWFQYAAGFGEMIARCFPEIDGMDSENLVERLVIER